jgi:hypothetical protein
LTGGGLVTELEQEARNVLADVRAYLASPEGQRVRATVATGLIAAAPFVFRLPVFRATPLGRLIGFAGGAALMIKAAELIRDWEPRPAQAR